MTERKIALFLLFLVSALTYFNTTNVERRLVIFVPSSDAIEKKTLVTHTLMAEEAHHHTNTSSCFNTQPFSLSSHLSELRLPSQALPKPIINLGFPKAGTTTLWAFFRCGGYKNVSHYSCRDESLGGRKRKCGGCMRDAISRGDPPLRTCGNYEAFLQMDVDYMRNCYWPQREALEQIHEESPNATFLLSMRNVKNWYGSVRRWGNLHEIIGNCSTLSGYQSRGGPGSTYEELKAFYCDQVEKVREFVLNHPSHALIEVDIEDADAGRWLSELFGFNESCWGHKNANVKSQHS